MLRLLIPFIIAGAMFLIGYSIYLAFTAITEVKYDYVRFRDGVLTLVRQSAFSEPAEVHFKPEGSIEELSAEHVAQFGTRLKWYTHPGGELLTNDDPELAAIGQALRYAQNTGLLDAEKATEG